MSIPKIRGAQKRRGRPSKEAVPGSVGEKIRKARLDAGLTTKELGKRIGVSDVTITYIETGQTNPAERTLRLLAQELKKSFGLSWLKASTANVNLKEGELPIYFGEEEHRIIDELAKGDGRPFQDQVRELVLEALLNRRLITDRVDTNVVFLADRVPKMISMDLLGDIAAGEPIQVVARSEKVEIPDTFQKPGRKQFVLRARGDSMIDEGIHDGSLIVCDSTNTAKNGDMVVALIDGEQATVKKFYREKTRIRLQPANKLLKPIYVDPERLQIQGIVVGIIRHRP